MILTEMHLLSEGAPAHPDTLSGDPAGMVARKEGGGDTMWTADASEREADGGDQPVPFPHQIGV